MSKQIQLSQGKYAIVDDEDFEYLNQWKWYANKIQGKYYAVRHDRATGKQSSVLMHRVILNATIGVVDHGDGNTLNNQKYNLRNCTQGQNRMNSHIGIKNNSGYKGVCWHKLAKKWVVKIEANGEKYYGGLFDDLIEAAKKYNELALKHHGKFAKLNKIPA